MRSTAGAIQRPQNAGGTLAVQQQLVVALLWTILGLAIALAALLMARRISGAFQKPLGGAAIVLVGLLTELSVIAYRRLCSREVYVVAFQYSTLRTQYPALRSRTDVQPILFVFILTSLVALTVLISLTIPGTPLIGSSSSPWLIVIAGEIAQWQSHFRPNWTTPQSILNPTHPSATAAHKRS